MADRVSPIGAIENIGWTDNEDGSVSMMAVDSDAHTKLDAIITALAAIQARLDEIKTALEGTLNVNVIP